MDSEYFNSCFKGFHSYKKNKNELPTKEEFESSIIIDTCMTREWSEPIYQCPKCGGGMCKNLMNVYTSNPPMYKYKCDKCGHAEFQYR